MLPFQLSNGHSKSVSIRSHHRPSPIPQSRLRAPALVAVHLASVVVAVPAFAIGIRRTLRLVQ